MSYGDTRVLHGVDVTLRPGTVTAVVGPSGAGKSTLAGALALLIRTDTGDIECRRADGTEGDVVLLPQEGHVFRGTVRDNLDLGRPGADDGVMRGALRTVGLDYELDRELDADTDPVSAQLLALARVVVRDPDVVICDEATSEAGVEGLPAVDAALRAVTTARTALVVAHRLEHAARADQVVVMRDGVVVEAGTHDELVAADGEYGRMWRAAGDGLG